MRHMRTVAVPATDRKETVKITCDLCGQDVVKKCGNADEVIIEHRCGSAYPEGGSGETVSVDMCVTCFEDKLTPWLKSQGAELRTTEWSF